jgi:hypothetical protein
LPRGLPRRITSKNKQATTLSIEDATDGLPCPPISQTMLLEEGTKGFQAGAIDRCQEAAQARSIWQVGAPQQSQECRFNGGNARKEVGARPFSADRISDQQGEKIDGLRAAEARV